MRLLRLRSQKGQSLIEVLIAMAVFIVGIATVGFLVLDANVSTRQGVERTQATLLAKEGLEAARSIRDADFDNLTAGAHGIVLSGNTWTFSGSSDLTDVFTRQITISSVDSNTKQIDSTVTWQQTTDRSGSVSLITYLTNWWYSEYDDVAGFCSSLGYDTGTCRQNSAQCTVNGETYESDGDEYCTGGPTEDTACCGYEEENTCDSYCQSLGYSSGTCRQNPRQCTRNSETHESGGDQYCTGGPSADTCCCAP